MNPEAIRQRILAAYPDAQIELEGEGCNFSIRLISQAFAGQSPIQRQRPVLALFKEELNSGVLHALSVSARAPNQAG